MFTIYDEMKGEGPTYGRSAPSSLKAHSGREPAVTIRNIVDELGAGKYLTSMGRRWKVPVSVLSHPRAASAAIPRVPVCGAVGDGDWWVRGGCV